MHASPGLVLPCFVALLAAACAGTPRIDGAPAAADPVATDTTAARPLRVVLTVDNRSWLDVVLYAVSDGTRQRIGMVGAATSRAFELPERLLRTGSELHFVADPLGETPYESERVLVQPGQRVLWTLESQLARSSILVH